VACAFLLLDSLAVVTNAVYQNGTNWQRRKQAAKQIALNQIETQPTIRRYGEWT